MKIQSVSANNRRHVFEVRTRRGVLPFPYVKADPAPSPSERVAEVFADPDVGREAFTYRLTSGREGTIHIDSVLEYNDDPAYRADLMLYELSREARLHFDRSGLSAREVARSLGTSPAQLYRLLDPTNSAKSARQLFALLYAVGCDVDVTLSDRQVDRGSRAGRTGTVSRRKGR